ncbi:DUF2382 domain-containing protein [Tatumella ptyseos]|uniref:DUF2382 domain-containing protein n=1 Tax=Tatumella ptyseos TaxID=82987 RepID=UPI0026ECCC7A|nr:DUF2382 domain-containing protein [Tatumella ptyseos]WKX27981.1 DUF2382 domain-containing protein [Tatumella ptyseos]
MSSDKPPEINNTPNEQPEELIIPLVEERIEIDKKQVVQSQFHVERKTQTKKVDIDEKLISRQAEIKHIPIGKYISDIPQVREENGVKIIPIFEEHIEIVKKIYLKEEIRIESHESVNEFKSEETLKYQIVSHKRISTDK